MIFATQKGAGVEPHGISSDWHTSTTLDELNAKIFDNDLIGTNDPRLSNARTPTPHSHPESQIYDLDRYTQAEIDGFLAGKAAVTHSHEGDFAAANHNHDGVYSPATHDHDGSYAGATHGHAQDDVSGLATTLAGKVGTQDHIEALYDSFSVSSINRTVDLISSIIYTNGYSVVIGRDGNDLITSVQYKNSIPATIRTLTISRDGNGDIIGTTWS